MKWTSLYALHILRSIVVALTLGVLTGHAQESTQQLNLDAHTERSADQQSYIDSLRLARDNLVAAGDFEAALSPAEIALSELEALPDIDANRDKVMFAHILGELQRLDEAETIFLDVIESLQGSEGQFSNTLIMPMQLLGRSYVKARRFPQAIAAFSQARTISQRNDGLFNVEQAGLIDDLTTAYLGIGDTVTARELQTERLETAQRRFGIDDERVIPFHYHLADYYERSRLQQNARQQYADALAIAEAQFGEHDPAVLEPLRGMAKIDLLSGTRKSALERIAAIVAESSLVDKYELGMSHVTLGDWAIVREEHDEAATHYALAYDLLAESGRVDPESFFADPAAIRFIAPMTPVDRGSRSLPYAWGTITLEFSVDENGAVTEITGIGSAPSDMVDAAYVQRMTEAYMRPVIADGKPVATDGVLFTHFFRYYSEEPEEDE